MSRQVGKFNVLSRSLLGSISTLSQQLAWEPAIASIVTVELTNITLVILVIEPETFSILPLQHTEPIARSDGPNSRGRVPGSIVVAEDGMAVEIAPVDLELYVAKGESAEGGSGCYFSRVERAFAKFH